MDEERLRAIIKTTVEAELKSSLRDAVDKTFPEMLDRTFTKLGIDPSEPIEAQKDAAFLRKIRLRTERVGTKFIMIVVGIIAAAMTFSLWDEIKLK